MKSSKKEKTKDVIEQMKNWNFDNDFSIINKIKDIENKEVLKKIFSRYKEETKFNMVSNIKNKIIILSFIASNHAFFTICVLYYSYPEMKLWLFIPLIFILISASYNLITDYYDKGKLTLVNSISDSRQKEIIINIFKRLPFDNEKEIINTIIGVKKNTNNLIVKKKRL